MGTDAVDTVGTRPTLVTTGRAPGSRFIRITRFRPYAFSDYSYRSFSFSVPLPRYGYRDFDRDLYLDRDRYDDRRLYDDRNFYGDRDLYGDRGGYVYPRQDDYAWQSPDITDNAIGQDPRYGNPTFDEPLDENRLRPSINEPGRVFGWSDERLVSDATTLQSGLLARPDGRRCVDGLT